MKFYSFCEHPRIVVMMEPAPPTFCSACGRFSNLYGKEDVRTGWIGWCYICNGQWHYSRAIVLKAKTEFHLKALSSTNVFVSSDIASLIARYVACPEYELRLIREAHATAAQILLDRAFID